MNAKQGEQREFWGIIQPDGRLIAEVADRGVLGHITSACVYLSYEDAETMRAFLARTYPSIKLTVKKMPTAPV